MTHPISPAQRAAIILELLDHSPELGARATLFGCPVELTFPYGLEDGWTLEGLRNRLRYEVSLAAATPRVADPSSDSGPGNPSTQAAPEEASACVLLDPDECLVHGPTTEVLLHERGLLRTQVAVLTRRLTEARAELAAERNVTKAATALARGNGDDAIRAEEAARTAGADTLTAWADELQAEADELPEYAHGEYWRCLNDRISETRARAAGLVTR